MTRRSTRGRAGGGAGGRGFTLLEITVAVGVVALIAVGLAAIFGSVGDTIAAGQRVHALNQHAAMIQQRMRADIDRMATDGFLVIRNHLTPVDPNGTIALAPDAAPSTSRRRRVDELMFFARAPGGEGYTSKRRPLAPDLTVRSSEARIYYGIGAAWPNPNATYDVSLPGGYAPDPQGTNVYHLPTLMAREPYFDGTGNLFPRPGDPLANRYASGWTLLRHVTVLADESAAKTKPPARLMGFPVNTGSWALQDSDFQVALQPAMPSVFTGLSEVPSASDMPRPPLRLTEPIPAEFLYELTAASGLVDVATDSIEAAARFVNHADDPTSSNPSFGFSTLYDEFSTARSTRPERRQMHATMLNAMPTGSDNVGRPLWHIRHEPHPTRMFVSPADLGQAQQDYVDSDVMQDVFGAEANDASLALMTAMAEADQEMLSAHGFVPRCTEFIVEWSYGYTYDSGAREGQIIWYGLERGEDRDGSGSVSADELAAEPYDDTKIPNTKQNTDPTQANYTPPHRLVRMLNTPANVEVWCFGTMDTDQNGDNTTGDFAPWPWPKLLRITMSIADPADPSIETTFQTVYEVPQPPAY